MPDTRSRPPIVTTVHLIVTPDEVIRCGPPRRPHGIMPEQVKPDQIAAIPALARRLQP